MLKQVMCAVIVVLSRVYGHLFRDQVLWHISAQKTVQAESILHGQSALNFFIYMYQG
jgi:hypothetical protein